MSTTTLKNEEIRLPFAQNKNRHLRLSSSQSQHLLVRKFQRIQLMATLGKVSLAVSAYFFPLWDCSHQSCTIQHLVMWTCLSSLSDVTHASTRGVTLFWRGRQGHLVTYKLHVAILMMPYHIYPNIFAWVVMDQPQMFPPSPASLLYQLLKQMILSKRFNVK